MTANSWFLLEIEIPDREDADRSQGHFFDVTDMVDEHISFEETADLLDRLTFTIVSKDDQSVMRFMDTLVEGMCVRAWFGPMDEMKRVNYDKPMFIGYIDLLDPEFPKGGSPRLAVTAYDPAWKLSKKKHGLPRVFPEPKKGHRPMTISAIVKKVLEAHVEYIDIGRIEVSAKWDSQKDGYAPIVQNENESDWEFLKRLAHGDEDHGITMFEDPKKPKGFDGCECMVYTEIENGRAKLYFVPEAERLSVKSDIQLQYTLYGEQIPVQMDWLKSSGTMVIDSARLREDRFDADAVKMQVPASAFKNVLKKEEYEKLTRTQSDVVVTQEEFFQSFQIDFAAIQRDEQAGLIPWDSFDFFAGKIQFKDVEKYVTLKIEHVPAAQKQVLSEVPINTEALSDPNTAFLEIEKRVKNKPKRRKGHGSAGLTLTVELAIGNHNIRPRKVYDIVGLGGKYSSSDKRKWFADTVLHTVGRTYSQQISFTM